MQRLSLITLFCASSLCLAQDRPLPPAAAAKAMTLPPGFRATLFAGEPDVRQPIAFTFDDRGRVWVVECLSYPKWTEDKSGHDRVSIYEDTNGDGRFDKKTVFFDKGANLSGIEVGFGGVWLCSTPDLVFIPDRDHDDKPDGPPQVMLDGWDLKAKHNVFCSLAWGPDGWLYGCNGILSNSRVGKPGTPDSQRVSLNCGVWRYHPTKRTFEAVAHGTTNPWGLDFDEVGEVFITNCVIEHVWHFVPGGHYQRMFGQDIMPNSYALMPSIADHLHWGGGHWTTSRGGKGVHDTPGGGHAHSGCMIYLGDNWPEEYRNNLFTCNIHGNRINRDRLRQKGSTYVASHAPDAMLANDPWFRGIAIKYGPDGGVYVSDWTDTGECHNYEKADQTNGRIFKITYGIPKPWQGNLANLSDLELVKLQSHRNDWFCRHARRLLQERASAHRIDPMAIAELRTMLDEGVNPMHRLRALWTQHVVGERVGARVQDASESVRRWSIRLKADDSSAVTSALNEILERPSNLSAGLKLELLSAIQKMPPQSRVGPLDKLLPLLSERNDPYLPLMTWYAIEPAVTADPDGSVKWLAFTQFPLVREFIARRLVEQKTEQLDLIFRSMVNWLYPDVWAVDTLKGIQEALSGRRDVPMPSHWSAAAAKLRAAKSLEVHDRTDSLGVLFGEATAIDRMRERLKRPTDLLERRQMALQVLQQKQVPDLYAILQRLLDDKDLRSAAIRGLAAFAEPTVPDLLLKRYSSVSESEKSDIVQTLANRPQSALRLLDAIEANVVPRHDVSPLIVRQMKSFKDQAIQQKLDKVWGVVRPVGKEREALLAKYRAQLSAEVLGKADLQKGRQVFGRTCATCHKLRGEGQSIAPDLTGSQRTNLEYLLENVIDPSAVVPREYSVTIVELKDGRILNGFIAKDSPQAVTIQTANERLVISRADIETLTPTNSSIMPEGLFDKLTPNELRDLVGYLMKK